MAATRQPIAVEDVTKDPRFAWVRGFDIEALAGMLSVPLVWHDQVVGVLNVQTREVRDFDESEIAFLRTIAALLAGIVEKGRLTAEVEARLVQLTALDAARAELLSVVTHELRTPLSVVRVYVDLLAEAATGPATGDPPPAEPADPVAWRDRGARPARPAGPARGLDPRVGSRGGATGLSRAPFDAVAAVEETVETLRLLLRPHPIRWDRPEGSLIAIGDETRFRQVLEQLLENESKYAPSADGVSIGVWQLGDEIQVYVTDDGPGVPIEDWESVFEPFVRIGGAADQPRFRDRAVRGAPADDRDGRSHLPRAERLRQQPVRGGAARWLGVPHGGLRPRLVVRPVEVEGVEIADVQAGHRPAVDPEDRPGDEARSVRRHEDRDVGHVLGPPDPPERDGATATLGGVARIVEIAWDLDDAGAERVDADPLRRQLEGLRPGHRDDRAACRGIERVRRAAGPSMHRGHVDDRAVPARRECRDRGRGAEVRGPDVQPNKGVVVGGAERGHRARDRSAGVVHEDVEAAEPFDGATDEVRAGLELGEVRPDGKRAPAGRRDRVDLGLGVLAVVVVVQDHGRAGIGQPARDRPADADTGAGHERAAALESGVVGTGHGGSLLRSGDRVVGKYDEPTPPAAPVDDRYGQPQAR